MRLINFRPFSKVSTFSLCVDCRVLEVQSKDKEDGDEEKSAKGKFGWCSKRQQKQINNKKLNEKLQFRFSAHKVIHRKYLIFHFIWFPVPFISSVHFFGWNFEIKTNERTVLFVSDLHLIGLIIQRREENPAFSVSSICVTHLCHLLCALSRLCQLSFVDNHYPFAAVHCVHAHRQWVMLNGRTKRGPKTQSKRRGRRRRWL